MALISKYSSARLRPRSPISIILLGLDKRYSSASAKATEFRDGINNPVKPFSIASRQPGSSEVITARPHAAASHSTLKTLWIIRRQTNYMSSRKYFLNLITMVNYVYKITFSILLSHLIERAGFVISGDPISLKALGHLFYAIYLQHEHTPNTLCV